MRGKTKPPVFFLSHFASFYPIWMIFTGWIGQYVKFLGVLQKFRFLTHKSIFWQKCIFLTFRKWPILGVWQPKYSFRENPVLDMDNMLDSGQKYPYSTFPNIFSLVSANSIDLSKSQKNHLFEKKIHFLSKFGSKFRNVKTGPIGNRG